MKDTSVILLAAGASSRMGQPKLALPFGGRTALEHALLAFLQVEDSPVLEIILAVSPQTQDLAAGLANQYGALLPIRVCMGGATRGGGEGEKRVGTGCFGHKTFPVRSPFSRQRP